MSTLDVSSWYWGPLRTILNSYQNITEVFEFILVLSGHPLLPCWRVQCIKTTFTSMDGLFILHELALWWKRDSLSVMHSIFPEIDLDQRRNDQNSSCDHRCPDQIDNETPNFLLSNMFIGLFRFISGS